MYVYDIPHKALRNALSRVSLLAGKTDYANAMEADSLFAAGNDLFELLSIHARDEDAVTLKELEQRCPGSSQHDTEAHERLHVLQDQLEHSLHAIRSALRGGRPAHAEGEAFYLAFSEFHALYLQHTAEEERVTQPLLWNYFSDEELMGHRKQIIQRNPPATLLTWFRYALPALNHKERAGLFQGFKKMASADLFHQAMLLAEDVLDAAAFERLSAAL